MIMVTIDTEDRNVSSMAGLTPYLGLIYILDTDASEYSHYHLNDHIGNTIQCYKMTESILS